MQGRRGVTYETHHTVMWAATAALFALSIPMMVKSVRSLRTRTPYVLSWWDGAFRRGKTGHPLRYLAMALFGMLATFGFAFMLGSGRWPIMEFAPRIPAGWLDLSTSAPEANYAQLPEASRAGFREKAAAVRALAVD